MEAPTLDERDEQDEHDEQDEQDEICYKAWREGIVTHTGSNYVEH